MALRLDDPAPPKDDEGGWDMLSSLGDDAASGSGGGKAALSYAAVVATAAPAAADSAAAANYDDDDNQYYEEEEDGPFDNDVYDCGPLADDVVLDTRRGLGLSRAYRRRVDYRITWDPVERVWVQGGMPSWGWYYYRRARFDPDVPRAAWAEPVNPNRLLAPTDEQLERARAIEAGRIRRQQQAAAEADAAVAAAAERGDVAAVTAAIAAARKVADDAAAEDAAADNGDEEEEEDLLVAPPASGQAGVVPASMEAAIRAAAARAAARAEEAAAAEDAVNAWAPAIRAWAAEHGPRATIPRHRLVLPPPGRSAVQHWGRNAGWFDVKVDRRGVATFRQRIPKYPVNATPETIARIDAEFEIAAARDDGTAVASVAALTDCSSRPFVLAVDTRAEWTLHPGKRSRPRLPASAEDLLRANTGVARADSLSGVWWGHSGLARGDKNARRGNSGVWAFLARIDCLRYEVQMRAWREMAARGGQTARAAERVRPADPCSVASGGTGAGAGAGKRGSKRGGGGGGGSNQQRDGGGRGTAAPPRPMQQPATVHAVHTAVMNVCMTYAAVAAAAFRR